MAESWFKKKVSDIRVVVDIPVKITWYRYGTPEYWDALEKELNYEARELENFIRDHRSRDSVQMSAERKYSIVCVYCGHEYDIEDAGDLYPSCCERAMIASGVMAADD